MKSIRSLLLCIFAFLLLALPAQAGGPALGTGATLRTRDATANQVLNQALKPGFWGDASKSDYPGGKYLYDAIWLRWVESVGGQPGYVVLITGTGNENFNHDVVSSIVIDKQDRIDDMVSGAEAVVNLGKGVDARNGLAYQDTFYFLDMGVFYATYAQRMYRLDEAGRSIMFFEKLDASFVDAATWSRYEATMKTASDSVDRRSVFGSVVPVEQIFGMFMVNPDDTQESRVTFMAKLAFSDDNWVASLGTKLPPVLRAGLSSGFDACVQIAREEQGTRGL